MIKILYHHDKSCPILICDICGKKIENINNGSVAFRLSDPQGVYLVEGDLTDPLYVHSGECFLKAEAKLGEMQATGSEALSFHLYYLARNLGLGLEKYKEVEKDYEEFFEFI